ncbi:hypothetical protein HYT24_03325 [Candidatus Pacearchaeota archaeon]|nr:hypothetical protein [Candidatus Pacearchaeota archaeon]
MSDRTGLLRARPKIRSFSELCEEFPVTLLDCSILASHNGEGRNETTPIEYSENGARRAKHFIKHIEDGDEFYVTDGVLRNYARRLKISHKERIRRGG